MQVGKHVSMSSYRITPYLCNRLSMRAVIGTTTCTTPLPALEEYLSAICWPSKQSLPFTISVPMGKYTSSQPFCRIHVKGCNYCLGGFRKRASHVSSLSTTVSFAHPCVDQHMFGWQIFIILIAMRIRNTYESHDSISRG